MARSIYRFGSGNIIAADPNITVKGFGSPGPVALQHSRGYGNCNIGLEGLHKIQMCDERQSRQGRESARLFIADCFQQEHTPSQGKILIAKLETLACEQDAATSSDLANYLVLLLSSCCCLFQTRSVLTGLLTTASNHEDRWGGRGANR